MPRILSQSLVCDLRLSPAVFNPSTRDFVAHILPLLPSTQQVATLTGNEEEMRLCKTGMYL